MSRRPRHLTRPFVLRRRRPLLALGIGLTLLCMTGSASAFSVDVHKALTERALRPMLQQDQLAAVTDDQVVRFWMWFGAAMASKSEPTLDGNDPDRFQARYPHPRAFDAFAIRGFLGFSQEPDRSIWGIEEIDRSPALDRLGTLIAASAWPDLDRRNQDRFAYDAQRQLRKLPDGRKVPADPMILNMGRVEGLSSQAHAHYELGAEDPSDDPEVLRTQPWNFVVAVGWPGHVETYAAEMAQMHLDLAILARAWGDENFSSGGEFLAMAFVGAGMHYLQDAAGPLHTVQVGSYDLFKRAKLEHWLQALRTGGGTWGDLPSFESIGLDFLHNHHLFAEQWLAARVVDLQLGKPAPAALDAVWKTTEQDDPELLAAVLEAVQPHMAGEHTRQPWETGEGAGTLLVQALARLGARDGGRLYDAALAAGSPLLTTPGFVLPDEAPIGPEHLGDPADAQVKAALDEMAELHARSVRRALTATRIYWQAFERGNPDAAARRIRMTRLAALDAAEARVAQYVADPPPPAAATVVEPAWLYGEIAAVALLLGLVVLAARARRRKARRPPAAGGGQGKGGRPVAGKGASHG